MTKPTGKPFSWVLIAALVVMTGANSLAAPLCQGIFSKSLVLSRTDLRESSVEIEINGAIIDRLFTTTDGTLEPVLGGLRKHALHPDLRAQLEKAYPDRRVESLEWDLLTESEKSSVISSAAILNKHDFYSSRTIPGLKYRDMISLTFNQPSRFLGKDYSAGTYQFKSSDIFASTAIEYMGPNRMGKNLGFELHLRRKDGAAENLISSMTLQKALVGGTTNVHQHIVAQLPLEQLQKNSTETAMIMTEFFRRVNYLAQMIRVVKGFELAPIMNGDGQSENMPVFQQSDLNHVYKTLSRYDQLRPGDKLELKAGLVGIRLGHFYDANPQLWGLEFRDLSPHLDQTLLHRMLNSVQRKMIQQDFGVSIPDPNLSVMVTYPNLSMISYNVGNYHKLMPYFEFLKDSNFQSRLRQAALTKPDNHAVGFLFHNWKADPLVAENPQLLKQVIEKQEMALKLLANGQDKKTTISWFLNKSGLYRHLQNEILN